MTKSPSVGNGGLVRTGIEDRSLAKAFTSIVLDPGKDSAVTIASAGGVLADGISSGNMESNPINIG